MSLHSFWTLDRLADALKERGSVNHPSGSSEVRSITTDTRSISKGDVFVALKGERFDGHDYLVEAVEKGAAALVVSHTLEIGKLGVPVYLVDDTLVALGCLGKYWRRAWGRGSRTLIAVAGSNGKTSTKDLIKAALSESYVVHATTGNLNNRIGVPLTLLSIPPDADVAVIELGTSLPGEVAILRDIAEPQVSVVTSIAEEHLEGLGDLAGVLREESACFEGVDLAVTPSYQPEIGEAARQLAKRVVSVGPEDFEGKLGGPLRIPLPGAHNLRNAALALAVAEACGVALEQAMNGISGMQAPKMRAEFSKHGSATVINDAYNSNPGSARAAIELLSATDGEQKVVILGTMRELGASSGKLHDEISLAALNSETQLIAGIGEFAESLMRVAGDDNRVVTAPDVDDLWPLLEQRLKPNTTILLKASRGVKLERILPYITDWAATHC